MGEKTKRLNLRFSPTEEKKLKSLMKMSGADNMTDVIRRSLAVYEHLWIAKKAGARVLIRKDDEAEADLFLL